MQLDGVKNLPVDTSLPEHTLTVGDKSYELRYDFMAFRAYQKLTGDDPFTDNFALSSGNLDTFLWAGIHRHDKALTLETVQNWITPSNAREILAFVGEAYYSAFPAQQPSENPDPDPPSA